MKKLVSLTLVPLLLAAFGLVHAADEPPVAQDGAVEQKLRASLAVLLPNLKPDSISATPMEGLYEVTFGQRLIYLSEDGRFLIKGQMIDLETRTPVTEQRLEILKKTALEAIDENDMIVYGDRDLPYTVTVFTDIDCGYCRKLHSQVADYNKKGIRVRYLAYPRAGLMSPSARTAMSVWCAEDRHKAMDTAKSGGEVENKTCENPVAEQYQLGQSFGISGTPALVLDSGEVIPGYVPPDRLAAALDQKVATRSE